MKRFILLAVICLCQIAVFAQKKYEMVVEKTDGTDVVFNVEDIVRTYFRERSMPDPDNPNLLDGPFPVGSWQECTPEGILMNDATDEEVMHMNIYSNGTGDWWSVTKGQVNEFKFSFTYSGTFTETSGTCTMTIVSCTDQSFIGMTETTPFTYENNILFNGEVYYKKINGGTSGETTGDNNVYTTCPDENHPHAIDLGLPSGTKWACCNVGANTPEAYGDYYSWGEVQTKSVYNWNTYQYGDGTDNIMIGSNISGTSFDAATVNWGIHWQMPTLAQCRELIDNCVFSWITKNGVNGSELRGQNGGNIFLPASGDRWEDKLRQPDSGGCCWTSNQHEVNLNSAYDFYFSSDGVFASFANPHHGYSVRPIYY